MPLQADSKYEGRIHRAKWIASDKQDGGRGQALKYRVQVDGYGFAAGILYFSDAAAQKSYDRIVEVVGRKFNREEFGLFIKDPAILVGLECAITTKMEEDKVVVQWLNPAGSGGVPPTVDDEKMVLDRIFGGGPDPFAPATPAAVSNEDTPF